MHLKDLKVVIRSTVIPIMTVILIFFICGAFDSYYPYFALLPVLGLVAGPYGAIVATLCVSLLDISYGFPIDITLVASLSTFLCAYFPYRLWYSFNNESKFISLNSSSNLLKLIGVLFASSLFFSYGIILNYINYSNHSLGFFNNMNFLVLSIFNYFTLGLLLLIIVLLICSYFNLTFYYPGKLSSINFESVYKYLDNIKFINNLKNSKIFDYLLKIWLIISFILLAVYLLFDGVPYYEDITLIMAIVGIIIMFKPINVDNDISNNQKFISIKSLFSSNEVKSFSLNEIFMLMFVIFILGMVLFLRILYCLGFLDPLPGLLFTSSFLLYLGFVVLFLIVFSFVLIYFEKNVSVPLDRISSILNKYFEGKTLSKEDNEYLENIPKFFNRETEISSLSRVLSKMNEDIDEYKESINNLTLEKEKIETELAIAHDIQDSFLPKDFNLNIGDLDISAVMIPARAVGGDFYDFFMIDDDHFAFVIGDVSDKGVPAALFMAKSKQIIQSSLLSCSLSNEEYSLEDVIYEINNQLCINNESCMFVTSWIGIIDLNNSNLTFVNAGHDSPIIKSNGEYKFLETDNNLVLGIMEDEKFNVYEIDLNHGDKILLYTDGVTDANNENNEFFGRNNLLKIVKENDYNVNDSINGIIDSVNDFTKNQEQFDDFTMLLVEFKS